MTPLGWDEDRISRVLDAFCKASACRKCLEVWGHVYHRVDNTVMAFIGAPQNLAATTWSSNAPHPQSAWPLMKRNSALRNRANMCHVRTHDFWPSTRTFSAGPCQCSGAPDRAGPRKNCMPRSAAMQVSVLFPGGHAHCVDCKPTDTRTHTHTHTSKHTHTHTHTGGMRYIQN